MALLKCAECGAEVSEKAEDCPKCGCPVSITKEIIEAQQKKKGKKVIIWITVLTAVVLLIAFSTMFINRSNTGYYKQTRWGMTADQVGKALGDRPIISTDSVLKFIKDYDGDTGVDAFIGCNCTDNSLQRVSVYLSLNDDSSYTFSELTDKYMDGFKKLYGEPYEEDNLSAHWNTSKSRIEIVALFDDTLYITYEDIRKAEE